MTVAELRAALAGYPADMPVCVRTDYPGADSYCVPLDELRVQDVWHDEGEAGARDAEDEDDRPPAVPTLVINDLEP